VINLSLQFPDYTKAADIPNVIAAITYATAKGSLVVAAAGNQPMSRAAYPAMADGVLGVGATTEHRCLTNYSNHGEGVDIVAPGGGGDANIPGDTRCNAFTEPGRDIVQIGLLMSPSGAALVPYRFSVSAEAGTSMAAPHASAAAALVIASGVIGAHPTPAEIITRLTDSADPMGNPYFYGSGLLDAARAAGG
jgi:serine protease